ncbi:MAG: hypothetical protein K2W82_01120 [Candidatus Obscuribacterales bacterium]|nr:hypothetical protein [Candidatus Obscuribacterales bacterium]
MSIKDKARVVTGFSFAGIMLLNTFLPSLAQAPGATPGVQGPIDISANEQEFAGDSVIARGNVRVLYKDSIILSPMATLFKDETGNPQRAIFTGHPRLTQGTNKIDAETLTFEIATQKIVAQGNAHSEVESGGDDSGDLNPTSTAKAPAKKVDDDDEENEKPKQVVLDPKAKSSKPAPKSNKPVEHIITDADTQEYDSTGGRFEAIGHVRLKHGDIFVKAEKLLLVYGNNNKPETAVFTGKVEATQNKNSTLADTITYSLTTRRLQATGNVKSKVIQEKKPEPKKAIPVAKGDLLGLPANASAKQVSIGSVASEPDKPIFILSDSQDYSKENGRVSAHGNVRFVYGDTVGISPAIVLVRNADGKAEKVVFQGRSQLTQAGRRWIADSIVYIIAEHRVVAQGNTKAMIIQNRNEPGKLLPGGPAPQAPVNTNTRLAEQQSSTRAISASKIEKPQ